MDNKDIMGAPLPLINTDLCIFLLEGCTVEQLHGLFSKLKGNIPELKMIVGAGLDSACGFSSTFGDSVIVASNDNFRELGKGNYTLRSNDVIFWQDTVEQPCIYSCSGNINLWELPE